VLVGNKTVEIESTSSGDRSNTPNEPGAAVAAVAPPAARVIGGRWANCQGRLPVGNRRVKSYRFQRYAGIHVVSSGEESGARRI
jgi:hypothetical protein